MTSTVIARTNVKGTTYYLHRRTDGRGRDRYVFARDVGDGALTEVPEGYEVRETLNGTVSLVRIQPRVIAEEEEQVVKAAADRVPGHVTEIRKDAILVLEGGRAFEILGRTFASRPQFSPVLRFALVDREKRTFEVCRMTYRGDGGWSHPLARGQLHDLVRYVGPHIGKESFFDLY